MLQNYKSGSHTRYNIKYHNYLHIALKSYQSYNIILEVPSFEDAPCVYADNSANTSNRSIPYFVSSGALTGCIKRMQMTQKVQIIAKQRMDLFYMSFILC